MGRLNCVNIRMLPCSYRYSRTVTGISNGLDRTWPIAVGLALGMVLAVVLRIFKR
jgi:hypothetical protein